MRPYQAEFTDARRGPEARRSREPVRGRVGTALLVPTVLPSHRRSHRPPVLPSYRPTVLSSHRRTACRPTALLSYRPLSCRLADLNSCWLAVSTSCVLFALRPACPQGSSVDPAARRQNFFSPLFRFRPRIGVGRLASPNLRRPLRWPGSSRRDRESVKPHSAWQEPRGGGIFETSPPTSNGGRDGQAYTKFPKKSFVAFREDRKPAIRSVSLPSERAQAGAIHVGPCGRHTGKSFVRRHREREVATSRPGRKTPYRHLREQISDARRFSGG